LKNGKYFTARNSILYWSFWPYARFRKRAPNLDPDMWRHIPQPGRSRLDSSRLSVGLWRLAHESSPDDGGLETKSRICVHNLHGSLVPPGQSATQASNNHEHSLVDDYSNFHFHDSLRLWGILSSWSTHLPRTRSAKLSNDKQWTPDDLTGSWQSSYIYVPFPELFLLGHLPLGMDNLRQAILFSLLVSWVRRQNSPACNQFCTNHHKLSSNRKDYQEVNRGQWTT